MNMTNKERAVRPEAVPLHQKLINGTTPSEKSEAEMLFGMIKTGKENALRVPNSFTDFRAIVAEANKNGDCIINTGNGYYRPGPDDEPELMYYLYRELRRAKSINEKVDAMREAYYGRY